MVLLGKDENMGSQRREKLCCLVLMAKLQFVLKIKYESILKVGKKKIAKSILPGISRKEYLYKHVFNVYVLIRSHFMCFTLWAEFFLMHF